MSLNKLYGAGSLSPCGGLSRCCSLLLGTGVDPGRDESEGDPKPAWRVDDEDVVRALWVMVVAHRGARAEQLEGAPCEAVQAAPLKVVDLAQLGLLAWLQ